MDGSKGIKIILLGESGVGKTNLINVSLNQNFDPDSHSTLTSSFQESELQYNNKRYLYCLWDTAGQERFKSLNKIFIKGAKIVMVVFSIDNEDSFQQVNFWINYTKEVLEDGKYILALVANKSDLYEEQIINDDDIVKKANEHKIKYKVTSAFTDAEGFKHFLSELIIDYIKLIGPEGEKELCFQLVKENKTTNKNKKKSNKFC